MILYGDHHDVAMKYEGLVRAAFNCGRYGDPFRYANADIYDRLFTKEIIELEAKRTLSTVIIKLIIDNEKSKHVEKLKKLDDKTWIANDQGDMIEIIEECISIINDIKKYQSL